MDIYVVTDNVDGEIVVTGAFKDIGKARKCREMVIRECAAGYSDYEYERFKNMCVDKLAKELDVEVEVHLTELME